MILVLINDNSYSMFDILFLIISRADFWSNQFTGTNKINQAVTGAHEGGIFSICILKDGSVITGGKDRRIVQWTSGYKKSGQEIEVRCNSK